MKVIAIANQKGGCSKTTTSVNLAASLALRGQKVLLIDLDPQGAATAHLGISDFDNGMDQALMNSLSLEQCTMVSVVAGLDVIPADMRLGRAEIELVISKGNETRLRDKIRELNSASLPYDFVIFDTPPNIGILTISALAASDIALIPVQTEYFALRGLSAIMDLTRVIGEDLNPKLRLKFLLVMNDRRTKMSKEIISKTRENLGDDVLTTIIPRSIKLAEAPSYGKPVCLIDNECIAAKSYAQLADEVMSW